MSVEAATNISELDSDIPTSSDYKSEGDDHIRLVKYTIKQTFNGITGISTSATNNSDAKVATTSMVQAAILNSSGITAVLPAQGGNGGKSLVTDGSATSWSALASKPWTTVNASTQAMTAGVPYLVTYAGVCTLTAPASPAANDILAIKIANGRTDAVLDLNGKTFEDDSIGTLILDNKRTCLYIQYLNNSWRLV